MRINLVELNYSFAVLCVAKRIKVFHSIFSAGRVSEMRKFSVVVPQRFFFWWEARSTSWILYILLTKTGESELSL